MQDDQSERAADSEKPEEVLDDSWAVPNDIKELAATSEKLAGNLDRNWTVLAIVTLLGFLYIFDIAQASALADSIRLDVDALEIVIPSISAYLYVRIAYQIGGFLDTRAKLEVRISLQKQAKDTLEITTRSYSIFTPLAVLMSIQVDSARTHRLVLKLTLAVVIVAALGVMSTSYAMAAYFLYRFSDWLPGWTQLIPPLGAFAILAMFYFHFKVVFEGRVGRWIVLHYITGGVAIVTFVLLLLLDPLPVDSITHRGTVIYVSQSDNLLILKENSDDIVAVSFKDADFVAEDSDAESDDLEVGSKIKVEGEELADGIIDASEIRFNPP